jgi:hypothetical protein
MAYSKFKRDLRQGEDYERKSIAFFQHDLYEKAPKGCKFWDLKYIHEGNVSYVEVKSEKWAGITGNLCIETMSGGLPSGISCTKAQHWVHWVLYTDNGRLNGRVIKEDAYVIPIEKIKEEAPKHRFISRGGDGGRSSFHLVPKDVFRDYLKYTNNL